MFLGKLSILLYFFVCSIAAAYVTCTLWMSSPKEVPPTSASAPVECKDAAGGSPQIVRLEPETVAIGENLLNVAVLGCSFAPGTKVLFNGVERISTPAGSNQLNASLLASDFAGAGNIAISLEAEAPPPDVKDVKAVKDGKDVKDVKDVKKERSPVLRSNVTNLRVKSASDVKVMWTLFPSGKPHEITVELRLILLVLLVGAFGACVYGLNSFANYAGEEKLAPSWYWLYLSRPILGAGMALSFYFVIRGGFLAGTNVDVKAVNPFGFVAVAALVGMFSDAALIRLNAVFNSVFGKDAADTRGQTLDAPVIDAPDTLPAGKVNVAYSYQFKAKNGAAPFAWTAMNLPAWLTLTPEGLLGGTQAAQKTESFTVQVTDSKGKVGKRDHKVVIS